MYRSAFLVLLVALCSFRFSPDQTNDLVMKAAESQLPVYIAKIPAGQEAAYGFTDQDNMDQCTVGKPFRMLVFTNDFYITKTEPEVNYLTIKNEWRVPVSINGQNRTLLTLDGNPGNFSVSGMGGTELSKELQLKSAGLPATDNFYLLRVFPLSADFLVSEHDNSFADAQFIPLASATVAIPSLAKNKKATYTLDEVQQMVKDAVGKKPAQKDTTKKKSQKKGSSK